MQLEQPPTLGWTISVVQFMLQSPLRDQAEAEGKPLKPTCFPPPLIRLSWNNLHNKSLTQETLSWVLLLVNLAKPKLLTELPTFHRDSCASSLSPEPLLHNMLPSQVSATIDSGASLYIHSCSNLTFLVPLAWIRGLGSTSSLWLPILRTMSVDHTALLLLLRIWHLLTVCFCGAPLSSSQFTAKNDSGTEVRPLQMV